MDKTKVFEYGAKVKDLVTGYCGKVTSYWYTYGFNEDKYMVESIDETGRPIEQWVDANRLVEMG